MKNLITIYAPYSDDETNKNNLNNFTKHPAVKRFLFISDNKSRGKYKNTILVDSFFGVSSLKKISNITDTEYLIIITAEGVVDFEEQALNKFMDYAKQSGAGLVYSNYYEYENNRFNRHPVIEYQSGSVRDDFDFGPILFFNKKCFSERINSMDENYLWKGLYALRLAISERSPIKNIPEYLYSLKEKVNLSKEEKHFDYLEKRNARKQKEAEIIFTKYLKNIGAYISPKFEEVDFSDSDFEAEASIIIPVKNRISTIKDAVDSALKQKFKKSFNVIAVDNNSDDGTTEILNHIAEMDKRLVHIIPDKADLNIGGCWNLALKDKRCGRFSVQLDSDDLYIDENTLQKIVDKFYNEKCGLVIGSYKLTDFNLNEIPPGLIAHKEWTNSNGHNNALRVNGFGAPRAFYTPLVRENKFPNVGYGEDYAVCLTLSKKYKVGRIYEPLYICRRWKGNSDAGLSVYKKNKYDFYKDKLRTEEILKRIELNKN